MEIPNWLTENFLKSILQKDQIDDDDLTITATEISRAVPKGTNYMSDIFRVHVTYRKQSKRNKRETVVTSFIIKCPLSGGLWELMFRFGIIQKEIAMYEKYLPKLSEILDEEQRLTPKSYISSVENIIILEDLNFIGFKMANRLKQLDYNHCVITLKSLALFHAASVKLYETNPKLVKTVGEELFFKNELKSENEFLGISQIELILIEISNWPELNDYLHVLRQLPAKIWDLLIDCFKCKENRFNVLNHGDCWITNMLFKYDHNNEPISMKFIDLQMSKYTTPAIDLIYFLQGSVQEDILIEKYDVLLNIYLTALNHNLMKFKCNTKPLEEFQLKQALKECEFYEFYANITLVPVVIMDTNTCFEIKEMSEKDIKEDIANNPFRKYLQSERYRRLFTNRLVNTFSKHDWYKRIQNVDMPSRNII